MTSIESDNELNAAFADSAPQQQVVNGWTMIDYLQLIALQNNQLLDSTPAAELPTEDSRIESLLLIGIISFVWSALLHDRAKAATVA